MEENKYPQKNIPQKGDGTGSAAENAGTAIYKESKQPESAAKGRVKKYSNKLPVAALALSLAWVPLILFIMLLMIIGGTLASMLGLLMCLAVPITAVVGVVLGIVCLTACKSKVGRLGKALAALAIIIPPVTAITVIALMSSGVIIIALM